MRTFTIEDVSLGGGIAGICPLPGRFGPYWENLAKVLEWTPDLVLSMTQADEMAAHDAATFGRDLTDRNIHWQHLPLPNFSAPTSDGFQNWPEVSAECHRVLSKGGKVLVHCSAGCGRSGMVLLRLMIEGGEAPEPALMRLRAARPCAVETDAQHQWAVAPYSHSICE